VDRIRHSEAEGNPDGEAAADERPRSAEELQEAVLEQARELGVLARQAAQREPQVTFREFERSVMGRLWAIGRTAIVLFLTCSEERIRRQTPPWLVRDGRSFQRTKAKPRTLTSWFGPVRYWRCYMLERGKNRQENQQGRGFYPLDVALGLTADRFSLSVLAVTVRLCTALSFATAKATAELFLPHVPSTEVIEQATLGLGRYTDQWFEQAGPPDGDGDVLVILIDSKGVAQVSSEELALRHQSWKDRPRASSARHRGRAKRGRAGSKKRRSKADKSKNAKMATVVVMYTLRSVGTELHGPVNRWVYASFGPKKHAFAIAFREASKRGFDPGNPDETIQIITDGDNDLARYARMFFPHAIHTLDIIHVVERLWDAGECLYEEGSGELEQWVEAQKELLYGGDAPEVIAELRRRRRALCRSQKNEKRRQRLKAHIGFLSKRVAMMDYAEWMDQDLEIASGAVEGAVKYLIGKRCDQGGMRWVAERVEAVVQLRCIEANGSWDSFVAFVHERLLGDQRDTVTPKRLQQKTAAPLPRCAEPPHWRKAA
jgi:hypothetical protein